MKTNYSANSPTHRGYNLVRGLRQWGTGVKCRQCGEVCLMAWEVESGGVCEICWTTTDHGTSQAGRVNLTRPMPAMSH